MKEYYINLDMERIIPHPYRVKKAGYSENITEASRRNCYHSDTFEICVRYDSSAEYAEDLINGEKYTTPFPHIFIKPPRTRYSNTIPDVRNALFFQYPLELYSEFIRTDIIPDDMYITFTMNEKLKSMFKEFMGLLKHTMEFSIPDRIDNLCFSMLQELQFSAYTSNSQQPEVKTKLQKIASFIQIHYQDKIDFDKLAEEHGFSRRTFYRQWNREYSIPPSHFQLKLKMEEVTRLLVSTNDSLVKIAKWLQFRDSGYLCKAFKKIYHCTPMEYRRRNHQSLNDEHYLYKCTFNFHGALNDFLPEDQRNREITYSFNGNPSVKDAIEALGIPHPEVQLIELNNQPVDFAFQVKDDDYINVYSIKALQETQLKQILPYLPDKRPEFILDIHLGTLARYLRMAGFDTTYFCTDIGDFQLAELAELDRLILLTRDVGLLKRANISYGHFMRNDDPLKQFQEIVSYYNLKEQFKPFSVCISCNGVLNPVSKEAIKDRYDVPPRVLELHKNFSQCRTCHKVYWKGTHFNRMQKILNEVN